MKLKCKRGQILILMATTLMAILLVTTLVSMRTFKSIPRDPEATVLLIKTQTRRAVMNCVSIASLSVDTDTSRFIANLQPQLRNIAVANPGVSIGVASIPTLQFLWNVPDQGTTTASINLRVVESQYKLDWTEVDTVSLQLKINTKARQNLPQSQFVGLTMNVTLTMNNGPSLLNNAVVVNGTGTTTTSYPCIIAQNYGNGGYRLTTTVPLWTTPAFTLIATDGNGIKSACTFVPPS